MIPLTDLQQQRLRNWQQTPENHLLDVQMAAPFIERVGIATLYPVSPEIPNLFSAYVGDPEAKTDSGWSTPSGDVYTWRWTLGQQGVAFYTSVVRRRPTWIHWSLLPAMLRLRAELRPLAELYEAGALSRDAYRIAQILEETGGTLKTGELRQMAGFPTGKPQRAAYLKAVAELEDMLVLAKVFLPGEKEMHHTLVSTQYATYRATAEQMTREEAIQQLLLAYLPHAVYAKPDLLAKHLSLPGEELAPVFAHLVITKQLIAVPSSEELPSYYIWKAIG